MRSFALYIVLPLTLSQPGISVAFLSRISTSDTHRTRCSPINSSCQDASEGDKNMFVLPIFPLRKSVRLPSDELTLNLYEDRYIALSEYVLMGGANDGRRKEIGQSFGALYCSDKPQFVPGGTGPITPLIESGDVGCVCTVLMHEDALVPRSRDGGDEFRRRIKLRALAVGRFRVERILSNGFGGGDADWYGDMSGESCFAGLGGKAPPFIIVQASRLDDVAPDPGSEELARMLSLERKLLELLEEVDGGGRVIPAWMLQDEEDAAAALFAEAARSWASWAASRLPRRDSENWDGYRRHLFSFAAASTFLSGSLNASASMALMKMTSTAKRLEFVLKCYGQSCNGDGSSTNPPWKFLGSILR